MPTPDNSPAHIANLESEIQILRARLRDLADVVQIYLDDASKTDQLDAALEEARKALSQGSLIASGPDRVVDTQY